jgi:hypothetical protein
MKDAFSQSWLNENNFLCPPFHLLPLVIRHLKWSKAKATLIAPIWPNQIWFQQLLSMLINNPEPSGSLPSGPIRECGTTSEPQMEIGCLQDLWQLSTSEACRSLLEKNCKSLD